MIAHCLFEQSGEVWRDVKGFEGIYQVSSLGNDTPTIRKQIYPSVFN